MFRTWAARTMLVVAACESRRQTEINHCDGWDYLIPFVYSLLCSRSIAHKTDELIFLNYIPLVPCLRLISFAKSYIYVWWRVGTGEEEKEEEEVEKKAASDFRRDESRARQFPFDDCYMRRRHRHLLESYELRAYVRFRLPLKPSENKVTATLITHTFAYIIRSHYIRHVLKWRERKKQTQKKKYPKLRRKEGFHEK